MIAYLYLSKQVLEATGEVPGHRPQEEGHACSREEEVGAGGVGGGAGGGGGGCRSREGRRVEER